jgi:Brp/Blh family beta-carotene 15,15'-monooxygenase
MSFDSLRLQGLVFSVLALLTVSLSLLFGSMPPQYEWWLAAGLIVFLGVPHGALDPLFAAALLPLHSRVVWLGFIAIYLLLAAAVVLLWWALPTIFLIMFLAVSVLHFSGDLLSGAHPLARFVYGAAVISVPAERHAADMLRLFSQLVGANAARPVVAVLELIAWPCLLALLWLVVSSWRQRVGRDVWRSLEIFALGSLLWIATPLLGFAIYFCAMHSARHILRTQQFSGLKMGRLVLVVALPMVALLGAGTLGWRLLPDSPVDARMLQYLFVGLAALTLPHMVLVERVRWAGWPTRASSEFSATVSRP